VLKGLFWIGRIHKSNVHFMLLPKALRPKIT
jgi:hypothetical protein